MPPLADIAVFGLAVMGRNLALNLADKGFHVVAYERDADGLDGFLAGPARGTTIVGARLPAEVAALLQRPRCVLLLVKAGDAVDRSIDGLLPYLETGDIIVDGGNSHYTDSERRGTALAARGIRFVGMGISGGEAGARHGPSLMPGGDRAAWPHLRPILRAISARSEMGEACCDWIGDGGAGHFVKMVHNGIEYGDMQLIAEACHLLRELGGYQPAELAEVFAQWKRGDLASYLVEIAGEIFRVQEADGVPLVDRILDRAGQKGTGRWASESALQLGVPLTLISESVCARQLSALLDERRSAAAILPGPPVRPCVDRAALLAAVHDALLASKLVSYAQGFMLMRAASEAHGWHLDLAGVALLWRAGCIIRSSFLDRIRDAYEPRADLACLLLDPWFRETLARCQDGWRRAVVLAAEHGIAAPGVSAALAFYDGYRCARGPANVIQAMRDYFGAHGFERTDQPRGTFFHHDWIGSGGGATAGSYTA
ncbi:decarboxylating NADP(+)-dependent phosphogluconate dehydrogenase [Accumulibacter sp.]|uniref:decarboxylating NADP(+)-dependent phosphogluconate dehydrogenase n=1 Tax=Accumulibacter sp. TaxID=2053492 RepID=UPI00262E3A24|nr:decarboxylating NADP(+)-dependent phosphogluconate dehydrogenase [Accumulibacter sp.]